MHKRGVGALSVVVPPLHVLDTLLRTLPLLSIGQGLVRGCRKEVFHSVEGTKLATDLPMPVCAITFVRN